MHASTTAVYTKTAPPVLKTKGKTITCSVTLDQSRGVVAWTAAAAAAWPDNSSGRRSNFFPWATRTAQAGSFCSRSGLSTFTGSISSLRSACSGGSDLALERGDLHLEPHRLPASTVGCGPVQE